MAAAKFVMPKNKFAAKKVAKKKPSLPAKEPTSAKKAPTTMRGASGMYASEGSRLRPSPELAAIIGPKPRSMGDAFLKVVTYAGKNNLVRTGKTVSLKLDDSLRNLVNSTSGLKVTQQYKDPDKTNDPGPSITLTQLHLTLKRSLK